MVAESARRASHGGKTKQQCSVDHGYLPPCTKSTGIRTTTYGTFVSIFRPLRGDGISRRCVVHVLTEDDPEGVRDRALTAYADVTYHGKDLSDGRRASSVVLEAVVSDASSRDLEQVRPDTRPGSPVQRRLQCMPVPLWDIAEGFRPQREYLLYSARHN